MQNHAGASLESRVDHHELGETSKSSNDNAKALPHQHILAHFTAAVKHRLAAKKEINEMVNYVIFLALFLILIIQSTNGDDMFKFAKLVKSHLVEKNVQLVNTSVYKSYSDVSSFDDFYEYLVGQFYEGIYNGSSFDGDTSFPSGALYPVRGYIGGVGRILGTIRLGQVRVDAKACHNLASNGSTWCFPEYSSSTASTASFGLGVEKYKAVEDRIDEPAFISITNRIYPGPAFTLEIPNKESTGCDPLTKQNCTVWRTLEDLRANKFCDLSTRAIFIDFSAYNPHCDVFIVVRLFLEQTDSGGLMGTVSVRPFRTYLEFRTAQDWFMFIVEVLLYFMVLKQARVAFKGVRAAGIKYYAVRSNIANDINIVFFFVVLLLRLLSMTSMPKDFTDTSYINFRSSANYNYLSRSVNSLNCFLSILKVFKYLSFIPIFSVLTSTVSGAVDELIGLFVMIAILLFGGSLAFTIAFGSILRHYSVIINSFYALMAIFTLKFDAEEIYEGNRILGPMFFLFFVSLIILIIMHMLIACFAEAYLEQKESYLAAKGMKIQTLGADIRHHILHNIIFAIPILGRRVFYPLYTYALTSMKHSGGITEELSVYEAKPTSIHVKSQRETKNKSTKEGTSRIHPIAENSSTVFAPSDGTLQCEIKDMMKQLEKDHACLIEDIEKRLKELEGINSKDTQEKIRDLVELLTGVHAADEELYESLRAMDT